ncbi:MAG: hypothetical protein H6650_21825 [Ardenticatenales bacterium]|nr:hypothetical protein [Ardenticatenales bacterium]
MNYEFHAHLPLALQDAGTQSAAIDFLAGKQSHPPHAWPELAALDDDGARMALLAQMLVFTSYKDQARVGARNDPGGYLFWLEHGAREFLTRQRHRLNELNLDQSSRSLPDLSLLPFGTFALHFTFTLTSPYLSKDDTALHLLDNPMKKEWLFKLPYVASTQWKGTLQATMVKQLVEWWQGLGEAEQSQRMQRKQFVAQRIQLTRLFGTEIENTRRYLVQCGDEKLDRWYKRYVRRFLSSTGFLAGRLYFYPTFFDQLSLEVINPHDRETGAGKLPIYFEAVPAGASASFTLLYTPLDRVGEDATETRRQVFADLQLLAEGLESLFTVYGFGAKTSSGFGLAELTGEGHLALYYPAAKSQSPRPQEPLYPEAVREFLENYPPEYLDMKPKQLKDAGVPNRMRQQAKEIKKLYQQYQSDLDQYQSTLTEWETAATTPSPPITERGFCAFSDLVDIFDSVGGDI